MPRLPLSTLTWCSAAAARFRDRRGGCLAVALLLDRLTRRWFPLLPTQSCNREVVRWRWQSADYAHLPAHVLVAGSFQSSAAGGGVFAAHALVPAVDGVHAVEQLAGRRPAASYLFVRAVEDGDDAPTGAALADPAAVTADDVAQALRDAADRLHVE